MLLQFVFDINGQTDRVMVSLEQHDIKPGRQELGIQLNTIGFQIMKVLYTNRENYLQLNTQKLWRILDNVWNTGLLLVKKSVFFDKFRWEFIIY